MFSEYDLGIEDIRAALKFAGELVEQEQHHPLPAEMRILIDANMPRFTAELLGYHEPRGRIDSEHAISALKKHRAIAARSADSIKDFSSRL